MFAYVHKNILSALYALILCCLVETLNAETITFKNGATVEPCFSYTHTCEASVVKIIQRAKKRIWLAGYGFTSARIASAIQEASRRGVKVHLVLDRSNETSRYSQAAYLAHAGIDIRIDRHYAIMHHKLLIADDTVGFGSMNFTNAADQKNAENFNAFSHAPDLVRVYEMEFVRLYRESEPYRVKKWRTRVKGKG